MDLDLRKLRYFVAVADTLHFGRAAEQLHIAQPVLSRQIRALEKDVGAALFTRDSHGVVLTNAGTQLLTDAAPLLASADAARRRVTGAARGDQRLMVGFRAGVAVAPAIQQFAIRHPDVLVDVQRIEADEQAPMLLDGRIDIGYVRLPIDEAGLQRRPALHRTTGSGSARRPSTGRQGRSHRGRPGRRTAALARRPEHTAHQTPPPQRRILGARSRRNTRARRSRPRHLLPGPLGHGLLHPPRRHLCARP
jgi:DNA-binding transcriptional LysR family regulator